MVGCQSYSKFLDSKCSSYADHSHVFIIGLILAYYITFSSLIQASKANCTAISSKYQHCRLHPAGVHDLDCFSKPNSYAHVECDCVWKPGNHISEKTYILIIRQLSHPKGKESCSKYENITEVKNIRLYNDRNVTAEVFENGESTNCTKAVFRGSTNSLSRCGPPNHVSFHRHSGKLHINVSWPEDDWDFITYYSVKYKALSSLSWNELRVQSEKGKTCTVENLNSSLVYNVQIQCVTNDKCSQCPWSENYTIPSELTTQPDIEKFEDNDIAEKKGSRLLYVTWKFSAKELYDSYYVTIEKASGEAPCERIHTTRPEIRLILSYSAYLLSISAVNNASISPAVRKTIPQREDMPSVGDGTLTVTVHDNKSFTVYWKDNLITTYVCYSVEWREKGKKTVYKPFYQNEKNHRTLTSLPEPLEPYKRYTITLHKRPNKETCNLKRINDSEITYGRTQFYLTEGTPVSAPTNISIYNMTVNSVVLEWLSILEEDIRGFLKGYIIHYTEYHPNGTERNITVDPESNFCELRDLKSSTAYEVQISGFTQAGAGVRSTPYVFKTNHEGHFNESLKVIIPLFAVLITVLILGPSIIKRTKVIVWPSIPNPGNSNAMQKIGGTCELELLESLNTLKVEEGDTNSLQIVEEVVIPANTLPLLHASEDEGDSSDMTCNWILGDTEDASGGFLPDTTDTFSNMQQTNLQSSPFAFSSEYTTMEMFNQVVPQGISANTDVTQAEKSKPENTDFTAVKPGLDYIRQFSTSPTLDSEMATIL